MVKGLNKKFDITQYAVGMFAPAVKGYFRNIKSFYFWSIIGDVIYSGQVMRSAQENFSRYYIMTANYIKHFRLISPQFALHAPKHSNHLLLEYMSYLLSLVPLPFVFVLNRWPVTIWLHNFPVLALCIHIKCLNIAL